MADHPPTWDPSVHVFQHFLLFRTHHASRPTNTTSCCCSCTVATMSISIQDMSLEALLQKFVHPDREINYVGKKFRIAHLKSPKGMEMNGQLCVVKGFDKTNPEARLHCTLLNDDGDDDKKTQPKETKPAPAVRIKGSNLIQESHARTFLGSYVNTAKTSPIPDSKLIQCLEEVLKQYDDDEDEEGTREDLLCRVQFYKDTLRKLKQSNNANKNVNNLTDNEYCFPCGGGAEKLGNGNFAIIMKHTKPACMGDEMMDLRYMDIGLKGDNVSVCTICTDILREEEEDNEAHKEQGAPSAGKSKSVLVLLPCMHIFHKQCAVDWLGSELGTMNWSCPMCRSILPSDMSTYIVKYDKQLQTRINEYPLTGTCAKCQIWIMERKRNDELPIEGYSKDGTRIL